MGQWLYTLSISINYQPQPQPVEFSLDDHKMNEQTVCRAVYGNKTGNNMRSSDHNKDTKWKDHLSLN